MIEDGDLDRLLEQLRLWHGGLRAEAAHFTGWKPGRPVLPRAVHADPGGAKRATGVRASG